MRKVFILILLFASSFLAEAKIDFIDTDDFSTWEKMLKLAKAQQKQLLVYVVPMGCNDCKELTKTTFKDKELSDFTKQNYLALKVFTFTEVGQAMKKEFYIDNETATLLILNNNEVLFYREAGFITPSDFLNDLKTSSQLIAKYPDWQQGSVQGTLEKQEWIEFLLIEYLNNRVDAANPIIKSVSSLLDSSDFAKEIVQEFIMKLAIDVDGPIFQTLKQQPNLLTNNAVFNWSAYIKNVFDFNIGRAIASEDSVLLEDVLYQMQQLPIDSNIENLNLKGRQLYLAELKKWDAYDTITKTYLASLPIDSSNAYQEEAIYLMEYYPENKPQSIALNYLRLGLRNKETFKLYYTLGLYLYNSGDVANAYKTTYRAYEMANNDDERNLAASLVRLIENRY